MEIEPADVAEPRADQDVRRIAGEPRARDAVLHDVEGLDHHGRNAGPAAAAERIAGASACSPPNMPRRPSTCGVVVRRRRRSSSEPWLAMMVPRPNRSALRLTAMTSARAERARRRHRHRIDQRAVDQPAAADAHRRKNSGQRIGGAHRVDQPAARQPDFMAGADLGRDGGEADRQLLDRACRRAPRSSRVGELAAADQAARRTG